MRQRLVGLVLILAAIAACDVPTALPNWDMTWDFPASGATISVNSFLPNGVTLTPTGSAFQTNLNPVTITRTLAQDCPQCAPNVAAPKPGYTSTTTGNATFLPANVTSATLVSDTVYVSMVNRYQFDPLNPGGGATGTMAFTVSSGATVLGTLTLSGPTNTIPTGGATTTAKIPVSGIVTSAGVSLRVDVTSPQGSTITLTAPAGQQFTYTVRIGGSATGPLIASSANLSLTNQGVRPNPSDFSFDFGSADKADSALMFVTVNNPLNLSGTLIINFLGCGDGNGNFSDGCPTFSNLVSRSIPLTSGTASATFRFGSPGAKALLNAKQVSFGGQLSGTVTVTPTTAFSFTSRIQLTTHTGSQ
jgi:hypothetical protein